MADAISEMPWRSVCRVLDPGEGARHRIGAQLLARHIYERPANDGWGTQTSQSSRTRSAQCAHQHGLDLIIACVSGENHGFGRACYRVQEIPSRGAPRGLGEFGAASALCDDGNTVCERLSNDECSRPRTVGAGGMIIRRDNDTAGAPPSRAGGDVEQRHRVQAPRNGEHRTAPSRKRPRPQGRKAGSRHGHRMNECETRSAITRPLCHSARGLYLLPTVGTGALRGIAWSARNIMGRFGSWRILHRAHLAEHAPWILSDAAFLDSADVADGLVRSPPRQ